jgi:hypothetical protein
MIKVYVLEVLRFITEREGENGWLAKGGKLEHVGYMKAKFRTKQDACSYYDRHNQHMRPLNAHNTYISDWDPNTFLMYVVREDCQIIDSVNPFDSNDIPVWNGSGFNYAYLK